VHRTIPVTDQSTPFVICLVGFPGVGKLTIAQTLARLTEAQVVDNHWINDPILRLVAHDSAAPAPEAVWPLVARVRGAVLEAIATLAPRARNFIFTYAGADEDAADREAFEEYQEVARRRGARFVAVRLLCEGSELARRIQSHSRHGRKLVDADEAFRNVQSFTVLGAHMPSALTLDVTQLSAEAAAAVILAHIQAGP
jgi:predicted kinase